MKIVHVAAYYHEPLDNGYQVYNLVKQHLAQGHEVHIITCDEANSLKNYQENTRKLGHASAIAQGIYTSELGALVHRLPVNFKVTGRNWWKFYESKLLDIGPDYLIVHSILEFQSLRLLYIAKKLNCPIVFDDHTTANLVRNTWSGKIAYLLFRLFFAKKIYNLADKIIGISSSCMGVLAQNFGLTGQKVMLVSLGTDTTLYYPDQQKRTTQRQSLGLSDGHILVVYTGKVYEDKKVHLLIDALNDEEVTNGKSVTLQIVGTVYDAYQPLLTSKISTAKNAVVLTPNLPQEKLPFVYNAADIAVWPAHTTISTLDASACGIPIVCADYMTERYKNDNGIGIADGDITQLKAALKVLINNANLRKQMGNRGVLLIEAENSWEVIAKKFIS